MHCNIDKILALEIYLQFYVFAGFEEAKHNDYLNHPGQEKDEDNVYDLVKMQSDGGKNILLEAAQSGNYKLLRQIVKDVDGKFDFKSNNEDEENVLHLGMLNH